MTSDAATGPIPFGSWPSPISADLVAAGGVGIAGPAVRRTGAEPGGPGETFWSELRPSEGGRSVLVSRHGEGPAADRLPPPWSARTRVHEYGGGAWWLGDDRLYFAEWSDQRLYRLAIANTGGNTGEAETATEPEPVTAEPSVPAGWRYADGRVHPEGQWLACVREDHHGIGEGDKTEAANEIVGISLSGGIEDPVVMVTGADFVAAPRFSPDGRWLSWVQWDHPNMPWETTSLCAAPVFANMRLGNVQVIAGAPVEDTTGPAGATGPGIETSESVHGADWTSDGRLVFSSDRNGFWNLYSWSPTGSDTTTLTSLEGAEIGGPCWNFGVKRWTELEDGRLAVAVTTAAVDSLAVVEVNRGTAAAGALTPIAVDGIATVSGLATSGRSRITVVAAGPQSATAVLEVDVDNGDIAVVRPADETGVDRAWFSVPEAIEYRSADRRSNAFFYPPTGLDMSGPEEARPPLIIMGHGGPTAHAQPSLNLKVQYWTSRGFAVVDVNYGGSSGFGRAYRDLLCDSWGIVDVEDCINAARHLAASGRVDGERLAIRGGSAGGFTVLAALVHSDDFAAGTSLYGVADLTALAAD
ncbi:MAG: prolyl oligopeptidase family serine peptidase, partial [Acidimicrobiales bacterium]